MSDDDGEVGGDTLPRVVTSERSQQLFDSESKIPAHTLSSLRLLLAPDILKLIQKQRLGFITSGSQFPRFSSKGRRIKDKFWFCRLSPNQKFLHFGDCLDKHVPSLDELDGKLAVMDIRQMVTGRECPHMKDFKNKKSTSVPAFSLLPFSDQDEALNFVAPTDKIYDYWTDGICALLQMEMTSKEAKNDMDTLLSMEMKVRLLDTEGVTIPDKPLKLPPPPPNFNFAFKT